MQKLFQLRLKTGDIHNGERRQQTVEEHQTDQHHAEEQNGHDFPHVLEISHNGSKADHKTEENIHQDQ